MNDFFKYLTVGNEIKNWGLYLNVAGKFLAEPYKEYPPVDHPSGYYFSFSKGRRLPEYQINYITDGQGVYEDESGSYQVLPGSVMIIHKNHWHRYKPHENIGWTEHYIGFNGPLADHFLEKLKVVPNKPVLRVGRHESLLHIYHKIFDLVITERPGYQEIASGLIVQLIGRLIAYDKQKNFNSKPLEKSIQELCFDMRNHNTTMPDIESYALTCNVGKDYFRNMFKKYTGMSPHQYFLDTKMIRAKELLLTTNYTVKEIGFQLGFQSAHYFNRYFLKKNGIAPGAFRKKSFG